MILSAVKKCKGGLPNGCQVFRNLTYGQRLKRDSLPTLYLRRLHADLVMCYKMVFGLLKLSFADFFTFNSVTVTTEDTGTNCMLSTVVVSESIAERVVAPWNSLPADTEFSSLNHRRQPHRGCRGRIPTNILVGGDINGNVPTNIRGSIRKHC